MLVLRREREQDGALAPPALDLHAVARDARHEAAAFAAQLARPRVGARARLAHEGWIEDRMTILKVTLIYVGVAFPVKSKRADGPGRGRCGLSATCAVGRRARAPDGVGNAGPERCLADGRRDPGTLALGRLRDRDERHRLRAYARFTRPWLVLGWIAFVPWLVALERARSVRAALVSGLVMAAAFELAVFGWFAPAIARYTGMSSVLAALLLVGCGPLLQPQLVTFAVARHVARDGARGARWLPALAGAATYVGTEWALPKLFADTLGYGLYPSVWLRQGADVVGVSGLTFALVVANDAVLALARAGMAPRAGLRRLVEPTAVLVGILAALGGYGALRVRTLAAADRPADAVVAGIVQANLSRYDALRAEVGTYEAVRRIVDDHVALSTGLLGREKIGLLVWPETVYPTTFGSPKSPTARRSIVRSPPSSPAPACRSSSGRTTATAPRNSTRRSCSSHRRPAPGARSRSTRTGRRRCFRSPSASPRSSSRRRYARGCRGSARGRPAPARR
jgi:hypothetical protein